MFSIIDIYYKVKDSNIKNKKQIKIELRNKFNNVMKINVENYQKELNLFAYSPNMHCIIYKILLPMKYKIYMFIKRCIKSILGEKNG